MRYGHGPLNDDRDEQSRFMLEQKCCTVQPHMEIVPRINETATSRSNYVIVIRITTDYCGIHERSDLIHDRCKL